MWFYNSESGFIPYYKLLHPVCFVHKGRNNIWTDFYNATSSNQGMMFSKYQGLIKETHKCSSSIIPSNALLVMVLILLFCKTLENTHTLMSSHTSHLESDQTARIHRQTYSEFSLFKPTNMPTKSSMAREISLLRMSLERTNITRDPSEYVQTADV